MILCRVEVEVLMSELGVLSLGVRRLSVLLGAGALLGLTGGCLITNTSHCGYTANGADNPCPEGYVCNVCGVANNGCIPIDQADSVLNQSCIASASGGSTTSGTQTSTTDQTTATTALPPTSTTTEGVTVTGPTTTTGPTSTTEPGTETETETATETTDSTSTTGAPNCDPEVLVDDPDCAPLYCVAPGQCGNCSQLPEGTTCGSLDPQKPLCDEVSGECAECTEDDTSACPVNAPICDEGACAPCTEHSQCPGDACDIEEGVCFPDDGQSVFYVKGDDGGSCGGKDGKTPATAFCTLTAVPLDAPKTTIRMLVNTKPPGQLSVDGKVVAIVAHENQPPEISGMNAITPTIEVTGAGSRLYLSYLHFRFAPLVQAQSILRCADEATFYLHDVKIEGNGTELPRALDASRCKVRINRARIVRNGSGIRADRGDLEVANSFIMNNGNHALGFGAFSFVNAATAKITYSTIARNVPASGTSTFSCLGGGQNIEVRNSAVLGEAPLNQCGDKIAFNHGLMLEVDDLAAVDEALGQWFNPPMVDIYSPKNTPELDALEDMAQWEAGDPPRDFSLKLIPTDGPSFAGAKQPG